MPLFMDRHDLPGITAEEVAQAHLTDIQFESKYAVQFLAYWFDADLGQVFCLARAARPEDMAAVHREGHGLVPNEIIAVSKTTSSGSWEGSRIPSTTPKAPGRSG